ncbi:uncharacterized protein FA14DRAFT_162652 [Meira miltonrushii]|uniref:UBL3-like ubiquitin domain-containing protein n=1 Tax=Meira miltonrushii TaxID=1280837 RepID=A0A316V2G6_9BASI|nr:uncharacterized protein FA14DRAFT_162652 [Meira miltonrushii]PWN31749.1 hypothetical protein FA14DRAFT_162652 [Meira miltonrushii]
MSVQEKGSTLSDVASSHDASGPSSPVNTQSPTTLQSTIKSQQHRKSNSAFSQAGIPSDKIRLDVLLISGQRRFFLVDPANTVKAVREKVWDEWPQDWPPKPTSLNSMRILHLGHILDDKVILCPPTTSGKSNQQTLSPGAMTPGKSTVVHLLIRQEPQKSSKEDDSPKDKLKKSSEAEEDSQSGCCGCVIS